MEYALSRHFPRGGTEHICYGKAHWIKTQLKQEPTDRRFVLRVRDSSTALVENATKDQVLNEMVKQQSDA